MDLEKVVFVQQYRTPSSEVWLAETARKDGDPLAQVDIHYGPTTAVISVTFLVTPKTEKEVYRLLDLIDDELVSMNDLEKGNITFRVIYGGTNKTAVVKRELPGDDSDFLGGFGNGA